MNVGSRARVICLLSVVGGGAACGGRSQDGDLRGAPAAGASPVASAGSAGSAGSPLAAGSGGELLNPFGGAAGANIAGGAGAGGAGAGGAGAGGAKATADPSCAEVHGCSVGVGYKIADLAANAAAVYWLDFGIQDGDHPKDGRLLRRSFDSSVVETLAKDLDGAFSIGVTATDAFVVSQPALGAGQQALITRFPNAGGPSQVVFSGSGAGAGVVLDWNSWVTYAGGTAFLSLLDGLYRLSPGDSVLSRFSDIKAHSMAVANGYLYFTTGFEQQGGPATWRIPTTGGPAELVGEVRLGLQVSGYGVDCDDGMCLWRMPLSGGPWMGLPDPAMRGQTGPLSVVGDRFFRGESGFGGNPVLQGTLSDPARASLFVDEPSMMKWVATAAGVFWTDGTTIYQRVVAP
jgi:hypothetical protein